MPTPLQGPSEIMRTDTTVTVVRDGAVQYVDGKPVVARQTQFTVYGSIQPLVGRDLLLVPEGDRYREQYWIWTPNDLRINDRVIYCGANYQVQTVQSWRSYNQVRIMRIDVGRNATP
jgi:hypothetical protein